MPIPYDLRYAVRTLRRTPVFTAAALFSLTLGIASSAAVFSLVDAAILRRPPFADADRLAVLNITQRTPSRRRAAASLVVAALSVAETKCPLVRRPRDELEQRRDDDRLQPIQSHFPSRSCLTALPRRDARAARLGPWFHRGRWDRRSRHRIRWSSATTSGSGGSVASSTSSARRWS